MAKKKKQVELTAPRWRESIYAEATKAERDVTGQVATLVSSRDVAVLQYELDAAREELRIYRDQDASLRQDILQRNELIVAAERKIEALTREAQSLEAEMGDADEALAELKRINFRLSKEHSDERARAQAWQATAGELQIENTRLKESQGELKDLLAGKCVDVRAETARAGNACQALFHWRLACVLLATLSATLAAVLFLAR